MASEVCVHAHKHTLTTGLSVHSQQVHLLPGMSITIAITIAMTIALIIAMIMTTIDAKDI